MYLPRTIEKFINRADKQFPVIMVTGARQVGKTTVLQHLANDNRTFITLDDPLIRNMANVDPALFMQRYTPPILIDEIQYAPNILPYIKMMVDREKKSGLYWLTGSQPFHLMKNVSESLAGRAGIISLMGFSQREIQGQADSSEPFLPTADILSKRLKNSSPYSLQELYRRIWRGSLPAMSINDFIERDLFYSSYLQTYLQRDVHDLANVGNERSFLRFLRSAAARTGQLLNVTELARDSDVSPNTAKNWLSILIASGIAYLLEPYFSNITKRFVKAPKLYILDTGLCAYLTEWSSSETLEAGAMSGAVLETWIVAEILKSYLHHGKTAPIYHYRDKDKKEIDLLIVRDGVIYPLEIKKSASPRKQHFRHFKVLERQKLPIGPGGVICLTETLIPLSENVQGIPVKLL